jgi:hypothetical protein
MGAAVKIERNVHFFWKFRLQNVASGELVYAVRSKRELRRTREAFADMPG